jgi:sugar lactone lactonase YvrE
MRGKKRIMKTSVWCAGVLLAATSGPLLAQSAWAPLAATGAKRTAPAHLASYEQLPPGAVTRVQRVAAATDVGGAKAGARGAGWTLQLPDGVRLQVDDAQAIPHPNGDVSYRGFIAGAGSAYPVLVTEGREASFALWDTPRGRFRLEAWGDTGYLLQLDHPALLELGPDEGAISSHRARASSLSRAAATPVAATKAAAGTQIDVLFVYTAGFAARYPGSAAETRLRHLTTLANQVFANSAVDLALRVTGIEPVGYNDDDSNDTALGAMARTLTNATGPAAGLEGLRALRDQRRADLVTLARPHDIETRGSCGIAYLFGEGETRGVNVLSDGVSSWSICSEETYAHEVGHNLGAEHQSGASSGQAGYGRAHVVYGQYHTVMGSFGTGDPQRGRRLQRFSNPQQLCGGAPCGVAGAADNARRLRANMAAVAAYRSAQSGLAAVDAPAAVDPDEDGDGVPESLDAFPHDAAHQRDTDGDRVADGIDAFPTNPAESLDTDHDGLGDNADPDRDNDGVLNASDALPLLAGESADADGDGVGDNADPFDADRREWSDVDGDGSGDNADADRDGDGRADFDAANDDLLVASVGTDRVLRLDGASGRLVAIEIAESHAPFALGPKSALAWNPYRRRVDALIASQVRRYDPAARKREAIVLESRRGTSLPGLRSGLSSGFAVGPGGEIFVADGNVSSLHRFDPVSALEQPAQAFSDTPVFSQPPRALVAGGGTLWSVDRGGELATFDAVSGALLGRSNPGAAGVGLLTDPTAMALGPDGFLYAADGAGDRVWRIDPANGMASVHVAPRSGGLDVPAGLAFDRSGRLYVASAATGAVLRYAADGTFLDVFSQVPGGTLAEPRSLLFVPRIADRYPVDAQRRYRPRAGAWYDPASSGQGIDLQPIAGGLGFTWYTYEADGRPTWYLAAGPMQGDSWSAPLLRFRWDGSTATPTTVGSVQLDFSAEDRATFRWTLDGRSGSTPLEHFQGGKSLETQFPTAVWYPPAETGWGYSVVKQGEALALIAFVYDRSGEPTWAIASGSSTQQDFEMLRLRAPDRCPGCTGAAAPSVSRAGSLRFAVQDDSHARTEIDLEQPDLRWLRQAVELGRLSDTPTLPDGSPRP